MAVKTRRKGTKASGAKSKAAKASQRASKSPRVSGPGRPKGSRNAKRPLPGQKVLPGAEAAVSGAAASVQRPAEPEKRPCEFDVPVQFGAASGGAGTASLPVSVDRACLSPERAVDVLCGHTLFGRVFSVNGDEAPNQKHLPGTFERVEIATAFEVKSIKVGTKRVGATLCFKIDDVSALAMFKLAKGAGRLIVTHLAELPEKKRGRPAGAGATAGASKGAA